MTRRIRYVVWRNGRYYVSYANLPDALDKQGIYDTVTATCVDDLDQLGSDGRIRAHDPDLIDERTLVYSYRGKKPYLRLGAFNNLPPLRR